MPEIVGLTIAVLMVAALCRAFYMGGREKAERAAWFTISQLRREIRTERLDNERLRQRLNGIPRGDAYRVSKYGGDL